MQDGTQIANIDAVIYCTGYQYAYPFLKGTGLVTSHDMRVDPLWQHIFPPNVAPTLSFVGLIWKSLRNPQFELQVSHSAKYTLGIWKILHVLRAVCTWPPGIHMLSGVYIGISPFVKPPPLVHLANTVLCELTYKAALPRHLKQLWQKWRYKTDVCNYVEQVPNLSWVGKRFYYCYQYYLYFYVEQASGSGAIRQSTAAKQTADGARCCRLLPTADWLWSAC